MTMLTRRNFPSLLEEFFGDLDRDRTRQTGAAATYSPNVEVSKSESAYRVVAHLPGATRENVQVEVKDGALRIQGKLAQAQDGAGDYKTVYSELPRYTEFKRALRIDERSFDLGKVEAKIDNGVLTVTLPVAEAVKPKQITIN